MTSHEFFSSKEWKELIVWDLIIVFTHKVWWEHNTVWTELPSHYSSKNEFKDLLDYNLVSFGIFHTNWMTGEVEIGKNQ